MDYPFTTDGCSGGMSLLWQFVSHKPPPWEGDCVKHDRSYHEGGSVSDRLMADSILLENVSAKGHPYIAIIMFLAVRVGGHPCLPLPWRWGYGWKYPRAYT